jgi:hypothetical protein
VVVNHGIVDMKRLRSVALMRSLLCALFVAYALLPRPSVRARFRT